ncbi:aladin-like protein [Leptotrombidium deliense]|uniref:Aladin-like protein n=1 Tax=Leptotrombidium deliense TaxID=299467 RepID=A0A443SVI6_9ACAR|nr:aladin-like protein [Leptotrombidium deliense]
MCSLDSFPSPQNLEERSLREVDEYIESGPDAVFNEELFYPSISIDPKSIIKPSLINEKISDVFIEKDVTPWKKAFFIYRCEGFLASMRVLHSANCGESKWLLFSKKVASFILLVWNMILNVYGYFYPYSLLSDDELCSEFSRCLDSKAHIRCFAWNPQYSRCAIALLNDNIFVYSSTNSTVPLVKHPSQKKVTDMRWKPNSEDILAVACQHIVIIWTIDPNSKATRVTSARLIQQSISTPVTHISYDPLGEWLAICSPTTSKILMVKQTDKIEEKVVRKFGSGVTFLNWSPDKCRLACSTTSNFVRVFENVSWSSKKWSPNVDDICQSACWNADGRILLFAFKKECFVYAIAFYEKAQAGDCGGTNKCIQVLDVSERETPFGVVGGRVHEMLWDKNGERLVIMFKGIIFISC